MSRASDGVCGRCGQETRIWSPSRLCAVCLDERSREIQEEYASRPVEDPGAVLLRTCILTFASMGEVQLGRVSEWLEARGYRLEEVWPASPSARWGETAPAEPWLGLVRHGAGVTAIEMQGCQALGRFGRRTVEPAELAHTADASFPVGYRVVRTTS